MADAIAPDMSPPMTIVGVRLTQGDGVECAKVRGDDGRVHAVSGLSGAIAIGDRVRVTGRMGHVTTCLGPVLVADDVRTQG